MKVNQTFFLIQLLSSSYTVFVGKGDVIICDYRSPDHIPKANSDLVVYTIAEIHSIDYEDLMECLRAYPDFGEMFFQRLEGSYSLQEYKNVSNKGAL